VSSSTLGRERALSWLRSPSTDRLIARVESEDAQRYLAEAIDGLRQTHPEMSAQRVLSQGQRRLAAVLGVLGLVGLIVDMLLTLQVILGIITLAYASAVWYRWRCFRRGADGDCVVRIPDDVARDFPSTDLPRYSILVPAYREPEVIRTLLENIAAMDYPHNKLEVLVLLEADDRETKDAIRRSRPSNYVRVVVVPPGGPKTKPKACNYGLQLATGELVTIFDAEDHPDPLQLRKAALALAALPRDVVCLQAALGYHNFAQNRITKWFTVEYLTWFTHFLPGLVALGAPLPLGGTSNHMRIEALRELGGWDPYNVTEDADLGLRLHRAGMRTMVLDSTTDEEANSDFVNWVKQRSRWYKGYFQTWLVHMRQPVKLWRQIGWRGVVGVNLFVGGTPALAALNPIFWLMTVIWFVAKPHWILALFPAPLYFPAMLCWIFGNLAVVYMGLYSIRLAEREDLLASALTVPVYWVMMSVAAIKGFVQLFQAPTFWEKTVHGLERIGHREVTDR
jgi:cellulose synthase/poly-beta-1,6-N-acetylglucosamine synthase-like glycosyltransferase